MVQARLVKYSRVLGGLLRWLLLLPLFFLRLFSLLLPPSKRKKITEFTYSPRDLLIVVFLIRFDHSGLLCFSIVAKAIEFLRSCFSRQLFVSRRKIILEGFAREFAHSVWKLGIGHQAFLRFVIYLVFMFASAQRVTLCATWLPSLFSFGP